MKHLRSLVLAAFFVSGSAAALVAQDQPAPPPAASPAPADKPADKPADTAPAAKPAEKPADKPADTAPAARPADTAPVTSPAGGDQTAAPSPHGPKHPVEPPVVPPPPEPTVPGFETLEKKIGYALGTQVARSLKQQGVAAGELDYDAFARGLRDILEGTAPVVSDAVLQHAMMEYQKVVMARIQKQRMEQQKHAAERAARNKAEGVAFLEKNKTAEGVQVTASGLQYKVLKEGQGEKPGARDSVVVHYEGKLLDGTVFDSSYQKGAPATFGVGQVIKGWTEALQLMTPGSTYMLYIPADLAYGPMGPPNIGPDAMLTFKVELLEVKKAPAAPPSPAPTPIKIGK